MPPERERVFPDLAASEYEVTSQESSHYNCIAWAAERSDAWWWPDAGGEYYWPADAPREETLEAFVAAYGLAGYVPCESSAFDPNFEKLAIYLDSAGVPAHAARQLQSGAWTSKLGNWEDIEHRLEALEGAVYGSVSQILARPR